MGAVPFLISVYAYGLCISKRVERYIYVSAATMWTISFGELH